MRRAGLFLILLVGSAIPALTAGAAESTIAISDAWMRVIVPSRPAAGYFAATNASDKAVDITSASSPACMHLMLHKSTQENGVEKMMMVKSVPVPAHGSVAFAPGGYHLMCMSPSAALTPGGAVPVTLSFSDGTRLTATFAVKGATGK